MSCDVMDLIPRAADLLALDLTPGTPEWLDARRQGVGGSEVAALIGASPWATRYTVWRDKAGLDPVGKPSWKMDQGNALEDAIARRWAESVGATLYRVPMLVDREHPHRRVNLDRIAVMPDGRVAAVEVKWTDSVTDEVPTHYLCQVLYQLGITGLVDAFLVHASTWSEPAGLPVAARPDLYDGIVTTVDAFWSEHVLTGVAPDPSTPDERLTVALAKLRKDLPTMPADEHLDLAVRDLLADEEAIRAAEARVKERKTALCEAMAAAGVCKVESANGWAATFVERAGSIRYAEAVKALGIPAADLERFRGEPSRYVTIRQKAGKKEA